MEISQAGDPAEREADEMADRVMRSTELSRGHAGFESTRFPSIVGAPVHGRMIPVPPLVDRVLRSPGERLDPAAAEFMEARFGHDFDAVRVHADQLAAQSARDVRARSYTVGNDLVFGADQYVPGTSTGRMLIAHELAHVVQQGRGSPTDASPGRVSGQAPSTSAARLARKDSDEHLESTPRDMRAGTLVHAMVIDIDTNRIALLTMQGTPIRGTVDTDLTVGDYTVSVDFAKQQWVFDPGQVKAGLRFNVNLEGALPFTLRYTDKVEVLVTRGFTAAGETSLKTTKNKLIELLDAGQFTEAYDLLSVLNDVDLADLLNEIENEGEGPIMVLLSHFESAAKNRPDIYRELVALEGVLLDKSKLYVDKFDRFFVDPSSFQSDKQRERAGKWNVKIIFTYGLTPARAIVVYADDIADTDTKSKEPAHYGNGGLFYPPFFNKGNTPRMWDAKKAVIAKIEEQNFEFIMTAWMVTDSVLGMVMVGQGLLAATLPAASGAAAPRAGGLSRPVTEANAAQPGRWRGDFEGGANMSPEAAAYEARVCHKDEAMGYYVNGVQFDGYDNQVLVDAKYYPDGGKMTRSLEADNYFVGNNLLNQAQRQLRAASNIPIEWRVASPQAAGKISQLFAVNNISIRVVFVP